MLNRRFLPWILLLTVCASAVAFQSGMASLGLTRKDVEVLLGKELESSIYLPPLSAAGKQAAKAMGPAARAAVVREIAGIVKSIVMSAAFQKMHAEQIKANHYAVDHGLKEEALTPKVGNDPEKYLAEGQKQMGVQMAMMFRSFPNDALKATFAEKQQNWAETLKDPDAEPEAKAMAQKMSARARTITPLMQSNPEEFKKQFSLLASAELGGPDTEAGLQAVASGAENQQNQQKRVSEQQAWNQYNLKTILRKNLTDFIAIGSTVDFAAQTKQADGRTEFVNPAYERKDYLWKAFFRAGREPSTAALDFARTWLKEL